MDLDFEVIENDENTTKVGYVNGNLANFENLKEEEDVVTSSKKLGSKESLAIVIAVFLVVNIAAILLFVFDIGNIRSKFMTSESTFTVSEAAESNSLIYTLRQEKQAIEDEKSKFEEEKAAFIEEKTAFEEEIGSFNTLQGELAAKDQEILMLQSELDLRQSEIEELKKLLDTMPETKDETVDISQVAKIYENMSAKDAANIISKLDIADRITIIKNIKKSIAAEILAEMNPEQSSLILEALMKQDNN